MSFFFMGNGGLISTLRAFENIVKNFSWENFEKENNELFDVV